MNYGSNKKLTLQEVKVRLKGIPVQVDWSSFKSANKPVRARCSLHGKVFYETPHRIKAGCLPECCPTKTTYSRSRSIKAAKEKNPDLMYIKGWTKHSAKCIWWCKTSHTFLKKSPSGLSSFPRRHNIPSLCPVTKEEAEDRVRKKLKINFRLVKYLGWREKCLCTIGNKSFWAVPKTLSRKRILSENVSNKKDRYSTKEKLICHVLDI